MGLLGLLSLLQAVVLPGFLLVSFTGQQLPKVDRWLLAVPTSGVINYCLVVTLTALGAYSQQVMLAIFALEVIALSLRWRHLSGQPIVPAEIKLRLNPTTVVVALIVFAYVAGAFKQIGTVFVDGDAVLSWDRWAEDWYRGRFAQGSAYYPQLLPTLYSLTYCFIGTADIKLFAKLIPAFWVLANIATWLRAACLLTDYRKEMLWGLAVFSFAVTRMMGSSFPFNGYADYPLMYLTAVIGYGFVLMSRSAGKDQLRLMALLSLLVSGAAVTKQSGVFLAAIFPLVWYAYFGRKTFSIGESLRQMFAAGLIILVVGASWYIGKYLEIRNGGDSSNLSFLAQLTPVPYAERIPYGASMLARKLSWLWLPVFLIGLASPLGRVLSLWLGLPFFLLWAWFVPYDYRNLALGLPALSITMAAGLVRIADFLKGYPRLQRLPRYLVLLVLCGAAYKLTSPEVSNILRESAALAQRQIGKPALNERLFALFEFHGEGKLATVDGVPMKLPNISVRMVQSDCADITHRWEDPEVRWLLVGYWCPQESQDRLSALENQGVIRKVFVESGQTLYEKRDGIPKIMQRD